MARVPVSRASATEMPFGPALVLGAWCSLFGGAGPLLASRFGMGG